MTSKAAKEQNAELDRQRKELEEALNEQIVETMTTSALPNAAAWAAVVIGSFVINLLVLMAISGG